MIGGQLSIILVGLALGYGINGTGLSWGFISLIILIRMLLHIASSAG